MQRVLNARSALATAVLVAGFVVTPGAHAKPSVVSGMDIPFPIVDIAGGCNSTGQVRIYPDLTPGLVATETISAHVSAPVCPTLEWNVRVVIVDQAPGFTHRTTAGNGTGSARASQSVTYATPGSPPTVVRGPANVTFYVSWSASNGVRGCLFNDWVVASYVDAYEVGPIRPCDDRIQLMD